MSPLPPTAGRKGREPRGKGGDLNLHCSSPSLRGWHPAWLGLQRGGGCISLWGCPFWADEAMAPLPLCPPQVPWKGIQWAAGLGSPPFTRPTFAHLLETCWIELRLVNDFDSHLGKTQCRKSVGLPGWGLTRTGLRPQWLHGVGRGSRASYAPTSANSRGKPTAPHTGLAVSGAGRFSGSVGSPSLVRPATFPFACQLCVSPGQFQL